MKAAVFEDVKKIRYTEGYPDPKPGPDDVIIKVAYCAICGSDLTNYKYKMYQTPLIMGHEFSGEIVEIGDKVKGFQIGDKATGINIIQEGYGTGLKALGIMADGAFAEYVKVPKQFLFRTPNNVSLEDCTMIESFAVPIRALKLSKIPLNQKIAIIGGGNIGLTTLNTLNAIKDPDYTLIIEPYEFLRNKAIEMGATHAVKPSKAKIRKFSKRHGEPDFIFECAGNESAFNMAIDLIRHGGTIVIESIIKGKIEFPIFMINSKEINIQGSISHDRQDILDAIELFRQKKVNPEKFISQIIPLVDIKQAFEDYLNTEKREFIKTIVKVD